jgi:hypothetical protein
LVKSPSKQLKSAYCLLNKDFCIVLNLMLTFCFQKYSSIIVSEKFIQTFYVVLSVKVTIIVIGYQR